MHNTIDTMRYSQLAVVTSTAEWIHPTQTLLDTQSPLLLAMLLLVLELQTAVAESGKTRAAAAVPVVADAGSHLAEDC